MGVITVQRRLSGAHLGRLCPYVGVPSTVLHKRERLNWTTALCRCTLDDFGKKMFSRADDRRKCPKFLQFNIYGTSLVERSGSGMTAITSWALSVHYIRNGIEFVWPCVRGPFRALLNAVWLGRKLTEVIPDTE